MLARNRNLHSKLGDGCDLQTKAYKSVDVFVGEQREIDRFNVKKNGHTWGDENERALAVLRKILEEHWYAAAKRKTDQPLEVIEFKKILNTSIGLFQNKIFVFRDGSIEHLKRVVPAAKRLRTTAQDERDMSEEVAGD